jgi:recombination protein RecA
VYKTRCPTLDWATGIGGFPFGALTIISGQESSGKTTLALHCAAEVQSMGGIVMYQDHERKLDLAYAAKLGVKIEDLLLWPNEDQVGADACLERSFELMAGTVSAVRKAREAAPPVLIVGDSINGMIPLSLAQAGWTKDDDGVPPAAQARVMSEKLPKLLAECVGSPVGLLWISQIRQKFGQGQSKREMVSGGNAPRFYSSLVVELYRDGFAKDGERVIGSEIVGTVIKSSVGVPFRKAEYRIVWGQGIDYPRALIARAVKAGVANVGSGGWAEFATTNESGEPETVKWQGARGLARMLERFPDLYARIDRAIAEREGRG